MYKTGAFIVMAGAMLLGGCATVSVIPGTSPASQTVSLEQSAVRAAAANFTTQATERGWIGKDGGFMQFARTLAHGRDDANGSEANAQSTVISYAERLGANDVASTQLGTDIDLATALLEAMTDEARGFLSIDRQSRNVTARGDLVSFEQALVRAHKVHNTFTEVQWAIPSGASSPLISAALTRLEAQLDEASTIADRLAREYTTRSVGAVS